MSFGSEFKIDLSERFPHLARAPIVEAVIHWRARSEKAVEREKLLECLKAKLPDYPSVRSQQEVQLEAQIGADGAAQAQRAHWHGFRFESEDGRNIAQFTRNGFVFSRVKPYEDWNRFAAEAKRLWRIHLELTELSDIERLGVRFINRIVPVEMEKLNEILTLPPRGPDALALPTEEFLHRSLFSVPGHPYRVNVVQTSQPAAPPETDSLSLILDINVFTRRSIDTDDAVLEDHLAKMRWLKNKAFNALLTSQTIARLKEAGA
jgi:uncharacterized protein (TIGR04255 family)